MKTEMLEEGASGCDATFVDALTQPFIPLKYIFGQAAKTAREQDLGAVVTVQMVLQRAIERIQELARAVERTVGPLVVELEASEGDPRVLPTIRRVKFKQDSRIHH